MKKEYLPSKKFTSRIVILVALFAIVFSVYKIIKLVVNRGSKNSSVKLNIIEKVQDDSNNNGIPDWEERLWGLNPNKNGAKNKEIIDSKRRSLVSQNSSSINNTAVTSNDDLSKEFFAALISLQQTGELDQNAMNVIADSISQKIVSKPLVNIYKKSSLKIVSSSLENNKAYLKDFADINDKYKDKDIGTELIFVIQALADKNPKILTLTKPIAEAYRNFGQDLMKIPVPSNLASIHIIMANNYEKNAESIEGLMQLEDNPLVGMESLINYKKYNDALVSNIEELSSIIKR